MPASRRRPAFASSASGRPALRRSASARRSNVEGRSSSRSSRTRRSSAVRRRSSAASASSTSSRPSDVETDAFDGPVRVSSQRGASSLHRGSYAGTCGSRDRQPTCNDRKSQEPRPMDLDRPAIETDGTRWRPLSPASDHRRRRRDPRSPAASIASDPGAGIAAGESNEPKTHASRLPSLSSRSLKPIIDADQASGPSAVQ